MFKGARERVGWNAVRRFPNAKLEDRHGDRGLRQAGSCGSCRTVPSLPVRQPMAGPRSMRSAVAILAAALYGQRNADLGEMAGDGGDGFGLPGLRYAHPVDERPCRDWQAVRRRLVDGCRDSVADAAGQAQAQGCKVVADRLNVSMLTAPEGATPATPSMVEEAVPHWMPDGLDRPPKATGTKASSSVPRPVRAGCARVASLSDFAIGRHTIAVDADRLRGAYRRAARGRPRRGGADLCHAPQARHRFGDGPARCAAERGEVPFRRVWIEAAMTSPVGASGQRGDVEACLRRRPASPASVVRQAPGRVLRPCAPVSSATASPRRSRGRPGRRRDLLLEEPALSEIVGSRLVSRRRGARPRRPSRIGQHHVLRCRKPVRDRLAPRMWSRVSRAASSAFPDRQASRIARCSSRARPMPFVSTSCARRYLPTLSSALETI